MNADDVVFTGDDSAGIGIKIANANLHDSWTFNYWAPGHNPGGTTPDFACTMEIMAPSDPGNPSGVTSLVAQNCPGPVPVALDASFTSGCPCSPANLWSLAPALAGNAAATLPGVWQSTVDFTDGVTSIVAPAVASASFDLHRTPLVPLVHGWLSDCAGMGSLRDNLSNLLEIDAARFPCFMEPGKDGYDYSEGVGIAGCNFRTWLNAQAADDPGAPVDIVAHSMGGLVARYALNIADSSLCGDNAGTLTAQVHSLSMLGTPNNGVWIAGLLTGLCEKVATYAGRFSGALCTLVDTSVSAAININSKSIEDLAPASTLLGDLNDGFAVPTAPIYRAHAGSKIDYDGFATALDLNNDCFVSVASVTGPDGLFGAAGDPTAPLRLHPNVNHKDKFIDVQGAPCGEPTLKDDDQVAQDIASDIKAEPTLGPAAPSALPATVATPESAPALLAETAGLVQQGQHDTHTLTIPAGVSSASFVLEWLDSDDHPALSLTLKRPDGTTVAPGDPDVATQIAISGDAALFAQISGFAMNAPQAGDWTVTVNGDTTPTDGEPYVFEVEPASQVGVAMTRTSDRLPQGSPELVTAALSDNGAPVAPSSVDAQIVSPDGSEQPLTLVDDGTNGDAVAGDHVYSATVSDTSACGIYGVDVTASGTTSEGVVTRLGSATFDIGVPGDAAGDPCNADDDGDGLTDANETSLYHTNPEVADTDADGLTDGQEINTYHTDPLKADSDGDGVADGDEVTRGTNPLVVDTDGDTLTDGEEIIRGTNPLLADTDGDGLSDGDEINFYFTNPLVADTDGDGCGDGKELQLDPAIDPTDPWDFYSVPVPALYVSPNPATDFRDGTVGASDAQAVFGYFKAGAIAGTTLYDQDLNGNGIEDGVEYDRSFVGPAHSGPPDGVIAASDAQVAFAQFKRGYAC